MKLIVGLGNPGKEYKTTRHNIGFMIVDLLSSAFNAPLNKEKFNGTYAKTIFNNQDVILLTPQTYMNLSGGCVSQFMNYFKIKEEDVLIIHDEVDLPFGKIQFKINASPAGHNGVKDIFQQQQTKAILRLRFGVGKDQNIPTAKYVLSNFLSTELSTLKNNQQLFIDMVNSFIQDSNPETLMNLYNKCDLII